MTRRLAAAATSWRLRLVGPHTSSPDRSRAAHRRVTARIGRRSWTCASRACCSDYA